MNSRSERIVAANRFATANAGIQHPSTQHNQKNMCACTVFQLAEIPALAHTEKLPIQMTSVSHDHP
jgi:hypothetical protein